MSNKPIQWEEVASMGKVQADHPEWSEVQCREEFNRLGQAALQKMLDEQEGRKRKRKKP